MKRLLLSGIFLSALGGLFFFSAPAAFAEVIHFFVSEVSVAEDGTLSVTETIRYDFEGAERHGIYRDIPYHYERSGFSYNARIAVESVSANGADVPFEVSRGGGDVSIRIGDPDIFVSGEQEYVIAYTVKRAINWFDGEPEVYWNATGNGWQVMIEDARATITGVAAYDTSKSDCFTGTFGAQESSCFLETNEAGDVLTVFSAEALYPGYGLTVVTRLPAGSIPEPTTWDRMKDFLRDNWGFILPVPVFALMWFLYRKHGRDPKGRGTIIAEYEPPKGMSPAMLGYLVDETIDPRDISAGIIGLAIKGHLKILYEERKGLLKFGHTYRLEKRKEVGKTLTEFERELFDALFGSDDSVKLDDLKKTFPKKISKLHEALQKEADAGGYFARNPKTTRGLYYGLGFVLAFGGFFFLGAGLAYFLGLLLSGGIVFAFAGAMPQKTEKGVLAREHILGFKDFLTVTEKDRLKFHNAPEKKPEQFMEWLPYAMALAVEKEWAEQFKDLTIEQPDWYGGQNWSTFNTVVFVSAMSDFGTTAKSQAFTAPNSGAGGGSSGFGGGGFSGGGFGGGGGGSW